VAQTRCSPNVADIGTLYAASVSSRPSWISCAPLAAADFQPDGGSPVGPSAIAVGEEFEVFTLKVQLPQHSAGTGCRLGVNCLFC
jgi:hypothetical protein